MRFPLDARIEKQEIEAADLNLLIERTGSKSIGRFRQRRSHQRARVVIAGHGGIRQFEGLQQAPQIFLLRSRWRVGEIP